MLRIALDVILGLSLGYLAWRAVIQVRRQGLSNAKLPFSDEAIGDAASEAADRARGALVGIALGDALGAPRESFPVWLSRLRYGAEPELSRGIVRFMRRRGTVTDDTQHTLLVARAIRDGEFLDDAFRSGLVQWMRWRIGAGRGTERAVRALAAEDSVPTDSQGNGAAMRVAPIAVAFRDDLPAMLDVVRRSARATHPNTEAVAGAEIVAKATRLLLLGEPLDGAALMPESSGEVDRWRAIVGDPGRRGLGEPGWVFHTVEAVFYLWGEHGDDWRAALREVFAAGGDTDTVAAIYMSFVGAARGLSHFPPELVRDVQGTQLLAYHADRLE